MADSAAATHHAPSGDVTNRDFPQLIAGVAGGRGSQAGLRALPYRRRSHLWAPPSAFQSDSTIKVG
jgi:hypothetical protein